ncbi:tripartite tricarboxylate transporter TctB family protein [uncultured Bifidobacterium sp.]|uniref:tripartite tricarboxylate transporter TctB family protein n=1 Tax=uncultured Bifidobacterium sp. TaxID=165187 RepID=UPI0028DB1C1B|nr:tripartite tricarboxylate transporter TctB family protein [uncultured Bifidobacterium sp.]
MANRAERRAQARRARRSGPTETTRGGVPVARRSSGLNEYELQERSRRLVDEDGGAWKPSGSVEATGRQTTGTSDAAHGLRWWLRVTSWVVICLSAIAFLIVMWLPSHPLWLIATVAAIFAVGILSLFFVAGSPASNPRLDGNGTAV